MKFRITVGLFGLFAGLVFGFSALPGQAHAATPAKLSDAELSSIQSVLDLTKVTLDAVQTQIDRNAIQDPASTLVTLSSIRVYLLDLREVLGGGEPASPTALIEEPEPVARTPQASRPVAAAPQAAAEPAPSAITTPAGEVAGSAMVNETSPEQQTASVSQSGASKRSFWIILITAVIIAIILAIPRRKKSLVFQDAPATPQVRPEESEPIRSA